MPWNGIPRETEKEEDQKTPEGQKNTRRPKNTRRRDLSHEAQKIGKTWGEMKMVAKDRKKRKEAVIALCPPGTKRIK